ncbi:MAG: ATP-binding protein, partial [Flavobacteriaceae bacterium]|nr:ATP-binding protein [Flavobacteriaceae bacterium]
AQQQGVEQLFVEQPMLFSDKLIEKRKAQYEAAQGHKANCFFDRGLPDVIAYLHFAELDVPETYLDMCQKHPYDHIFILPPWKAIYKTDAERYESFEQAERIFECLSMTYKNFGYRLIELPKVPVAARFNHIIQHLHG